MNDRWNVAQKYEQEEWLKDRDRVLSQEYINSKKLYSKNILKWFMKFKTISDEINRGHPHSFSSYQINKLITKHLDIIDTQHDNKINYTNYKGLTKLRKLLVGQKMYRYMVEKND